jgi:hypothetical protein
MREHPLRVFWLGDREPVRFAAQELARALGGMTGRRVRARQGWAETMEEPGVWVGCAADFPDATECARSDHPFDDALAVDAGDGRARVVGANPRSVVFAAYRYLEELGCRWFRPGRVGERIPRVPQPLVKDVRLRETPSSRHRVLCIEGACSEGHVRDLIDYAARRGFNAYFLQFRNAFTFFDRWHTQEAPRRIRFQHAQAEAICRRIKQEALRRGMILHTVGHGWTCEPYGIPGEAWIPSRKPLPALARRVLAQVKGKRELCAGVALDTQLCYSQPGVRRRMAAAVAEYARQHPREEVVHVWLGDGANNNCECPGCSRARPSDFYVMILNEVDRRLTAQGATTRIMFLAYVDLLWAPQRERLRHPDRFILMFAPITRSYSSTFLAARSQSPEKPDPFRRNRLVFPRSPGANLALLDGWRRCFHGDCVDYDYHLWHDWLNDPGQLQLAQVLHRDVRNLRRIGMQGFISCQVQRPFFPTGIWMEAMGRGLWDETSSFAEVSRRYFSDLFGPASAGVRTYLGEISRLFAPRFLRGEMPGAAAKRAALARLARVAGTAARFRPTIRAGCRSSDAVAAAAWRILDAHAWYVGALADLHLAHLRQDAEALDQAYAALEKGLQSRLSILHPVLDTWTVRHYVPRKLTPTPT